MAISQVAISVCNDGNVSQLDCTDTINGGVYYRIEVYRCSQPTGGYGVTLSGSRVEDICGRDHLEEESNRTFRYMFSVTDWQERSGGGTVPIVLEGYEQFNPKGAPDGGWEVRLRDLDASSQSYGAVLRVMARPSASDDQYELTYEVRVPSQAKPVLIDSPLARRITQLNASLSDLGSSVAKLGAVQRPKTRGSQAGRSQNGTIHLDLSMTKGDVDERLGPIESLLSERRFGRFRKNLDTYEAFGDFGPKAIHPGTNLIGPNRELASESIFARQYRAALIFVGRVSSPEMAEGAAEPLSLAERRTNTRPGVYEKFVTARTSNVAIYKLGLDKVHSDYGGVPMKLAPGSRMEDGTEPLADAWRCNQTLGEIGKLFYLTN
jgi:hypothetical protein